MTKAVCVNPHYRKLMVKDRSHTFWEKEDSFQVAFFFLQNNPSSQLSFDGIWNGLNRLGCTYHYYVILNVNLNSIHLSTLK